MTKDILEFIKDMLLSAIKSFDSLVVDATDILTTNDRVTTAWAKAIALSGKISPFCNVIIGICLLLELANMASKVDMLKWEHGLKMGVKMCLAKAAMDFAPNLLEACYVQASKFITEIGSGSSVTLYSTCQAPIETAINGVTGLGNAISLLGTAIILQIAIKLCGIIVVVMAYGRMFEVLAHVIVSPIPVAFLPLGDGNGNGYSRITTRFLKSFAAVCLQGVLMIACIHLFGILVDTAFDTMANNISTSSLKNTTKVSDLCFSMIMFAVILVMSITKCSSWAKSIMDA